VVLTDLGMPGGGGAEATRQIRLLHPLVAVLVVTMLETDEALFSALRAGANGYLLKGAGRAEIVRAVQDVAAGKAVYGAAVACRIVDFFTGVQQDYAATVFPELTSREREVLDLAATACGNHERSPEGSSSEMTVRNHVSAILFKLRVADRPTAIVKARDAGPGHGLP